MKADGLESKKLNKLLRRLRGARLYSNKKKSLLLINELKPEWTSYISQSFLLQHAGLKKSLFMHFISQEVHQPQLSSVKILEFM